MEVVRPSILVVRQDMHIGSYWIAEQLYSQNVSTFFQFKGNCGQGSNLTAVEALQRLFATGCGCMGWPGMSGRIDAYCSGRCKHVPEPSCQAVAVVDGVGPEVASVIAQQGTKLVTLERENVVKTAVSQYPHRGSNSGLI